MNLRFFLLVRCHGHRVAFHKLEQDTPNKGKGTWELLRAYSWSLYLLCWTRDKLAKPRSAGPALRWPGAGIAGGPRVVFLRLLQRR